MTSFAECGLAVGHATDAEGATGCTVVRGERGPFRCGVAVVGRATGTRELAQLEPSHLVDRVDAILLAGGSAYGLDAAAGVMRWMEERGRGFRVGAGGASLVAWQISEEFQGTRSTRNEARERDAYVYFDNDAKVRAPFDAISLARRLRLKSPV